MEAKLLAHAGRRVLLLPADGPSVNHPKNANDFIGATYGLEVDFVAIPVARLGPDFLRLSSRVAGEFLQKFVTYGLGVVLLGDVSAEVAASEALRDFVRESNRGRQVFFLPDVAALEAKLASLG